MRIAHLYWDFAPHIVGGAAKKYACDIIPDGVVFMRDMGHWDQVKVDDGNREWISRLPEGVYAGYLKRAFWQRLRWSHYVKFLFSLLLPEYSLISFIKLVRGPRNILLHGKVLGLGTMLWLRLFLRRIVLIHWGGYISIRGRKSSFFLARSFGLLNHIFVLMEPEEAMVKAISPNIRVSTLSYVSSDSTGVQHCDYTKQSLLIGNSSWSVDAYDDFLKTHRFDGWGKIICMLNYGMENAQERVVDFIEKYHQRFGSAFSPWTETVPIEQYKETMKNSAFYVCPAAWQTGLGAIYTGVWMGKTLFLRGDNYEWAKILGLKVYNIDDISDFSYDAINILGLTAEERHQNRECLKSYFAKNNSTWATRVMSAFKGR